MTRFFSLTLLFVATSICFIEMHITSAKAVDCSEYVCDNSKDEECEDASVDCSENCERNCGTMASDQCEPSCRDACDTVCLDQMGECLEKVEQIVEDCGVTDGVIPPEVDDAYCTSGTPGTLDNEGL